MNRFYTAIALLLASATTWAQTPAAAPLQWAGNDTQANGATTVYQAGADTPAKTVWKADTALPGASDIITDQPEGTLYQDMYRTCTGFNDGYEKTFDAYAADVVISKDKKKVYIKNFCPVFSTGWIVGDMDETGLVEFKFPQAVYLATSSDDSEEQEVNYAYKMIVDDVNLKITVDQTTQTVQFRWDGSKLAQVNATDCIALASAAGKFRGYGSVNNVFSVVTDVPVKPSADLKSQIYKMTYTDYLTQKAASKNVKLVFDGNNVYMGGFYNNYWIKGTLTGGKVSFPNKQYLGTETIIQKIHEYMIAFQIDTNRENADFVDNLVFDYDAAAGTMTNSTLSFAVNQGYTQFGVNQIYELPSLAKTDYVIADPAKPVIVEAHAYDATEKYGAMAYELSNLSVDGKEMNTDDIYYNVYLDGVLQTFTPASYQCLSADMTDVPYGFIDYQVTQSTGVVGYDFALYEGLQQIYLYKDFKKIGLKAVYVDGANRYESELAEYDPTAIRLTQLADGSDVKSVYYTDLSGRKVASPVHGLYLKTVVYADGQTQTVKILK